MQARWPLSALARAAALTLLCVAFAAPAHAEIIFGSEDVEEGWTFSPTGYLRVGYRHVTRDANVDFVGRNNGFHIANARLGLLGESHDGFSFKLTVDGAVDSERGVNTPQGDIDVALRDAYLRWDFIRHIGVQVGQFDAPFTAESMRSTSRLTFIHRAVGQEGIDAGAGLELRGLDVSRQVGAMVSTPGVIDDGLIYWGLWAMVAAGNGANERFNDNNRFAFFARGQVGFLDVLTLGVSGYLNDRTEGDRPNTFVEEDRVFALDLELLWLGFRAYGELIRQQTRFATEGRAERDQRAFHAQTSYTIQTDAVHITPAYRFATFDPFADLESDEELQGQGALQYHTIGLALDHPHRDVRVGANLEYTRTVEAEGQALNNDAVQALVRVAF